jgi:ABC-type transport system substrate-binding protein
MPISRRFKLLFACLFVSSFLLVPATASRAATPHKGAPPNTIPKKGVIKFSDWQFPDTLNLYQAGLGVDAYVMNFALESLLAYNNKAKLFADLLTNVPSIKNHEILNKGRTVVLTLRKGVYWSNGKEITNQDIKFGWMMYMDPATGPACLGSCDHITSITLKGKYQATLHLRDNYAPILATGLPPVYPHNWPALGLTAHDAAVKISQDSTFNYEDSSYVTNGPYQVTQFVKNDRIVLTPMKYYHVHPGGYAKQVIFAWYADKNSLEAAAANGDTDVTTDYTQADLPALKGHSKTYNLWPTPSFVAEHLEFNSYDATYNGSPNPVHNLKVRQALALGVDKIGLMESALQLSAKDAKAAVAYTPFTVTPTFKQQFGDAALKGDWDPIAKKYLPYGTKAVADAKKLLTQAGYANGFHLDFLTTAGNPTRDAEFAVVQKNWSDLGVSMTEHTTPPSSFAADWQSGGPRNHGQFQVELWAIGNAPDPDNLKFYFESQFIDRAQTTHSAINANYSGIDNPKIDKAMSAAATSFDNKVRTKNYKTVQELLNQNAYWIDLYYRENIVTSDKHITGDTPYPGGGYFGNTWNPWSWKPLGS